MIPRLKLGGDPSRSEGGAVCSKMRSDLVDFREALLFIIGALRECYEERATREP